MKAVEKSHYESDSCGFSDLLDERQGGIEKLFWKCLALDVCEYSSRHVQ